MPCEIEFWKGAQLKHWPMQCTKSASLTVGYNHTSWSFCLATSIALWSLCKSMRPLNLTPWSPVSICPNELLHFGGEGDAIMPFGGAQEVRAGWGEFFIESPGGPPWSSQCFTRRILGIWFFARPLRQRGHCRMFSNQFAGHYIAENSIITK